MKKINKNILANFAGSIWNGFIGLVFVPVYIHFLGIEAYGLIGFFVTLLTIFGILDLGLSGTLNREMARLSVQEGNAKDIRDLVRTLELPYWLIGFIISIIIIIGSTHIANRWVNTSIISQATVRTSCILMGLTLAFQWPIGYYSGGLLGLQHQVRLNIINIVIGTVRGVGAVLILWKISPTVEAFFIWQTIISILNVGWLHWTLWRQLPFHMEAPRFRKELFSEIWKFAVSISGITIISAIMTQMDKIVISGMLSLEAFGYYSMASVVAMTLLRLVAPVYSAAYPRMTNLVALDAGKELSAIYHSTSQLVSLIILPTTLVITLFSRDLMMLWTRNAASAEHTYMFVSILVMGTAFNSLNHIPYALQLAHGWTKLAILINVCSLVILVPLMVFLTKGYGALGATSLWFLVNLIQLAITIPVMHRKLLPNEKWRWCLQDVGMPLMVAAIIVGGMRLVPMKDGQIYRSGSFIIATYLMALAATAVAVPTSRKFLGVCLEKNSITFK